MDLLEITKLINSNISKKEAEQITSLISSELIINSKIKEIKELTDCVRSDKVEAVRNQMFEPAAYLRDIEKSIYYQIENSITILENKNQFCSNDINEEKLNKNSKISDFTCD